jgi:predicted HTH domain antitoxin
MFTLGENFPEALRIQFAEHNVTLGSVIKIYDKSAGKEKWHLIVNITADKIMTATVRINSEINLRCISPSLVPYQLPIKKFDFTFLDHDSFVNCAELIGHQTDLFLQLLKERPAALKGSVGDEKIDEIRALIIDCYAIPQNIKEKFGLI